MPKKESYLCEVCGLEYQQKKMAAKCEGRSENSHVYSELKEAWHG